jgi:hypothetical protein
MSGLGRDIRALRIVGPAVCRGCGASVWWRMTWAWSGWTDADGRRHGCDGRGKA